MNGNERKTPKVPKNNKQSEKMAPHDLVVRISELLKGNTDSFYVFFVNQGLSYDIKNCTKEEMDGFISLLQEDRLKLIVYDCLDDYFYEEYHEEDYEDNCKIPSSGDINKQQEFIEKFIKEYIQKNKDDNDEKD